MTAIDPDRLDVDAAAQLLSVGVQWLDVLTDAGRYTVKETLVALAHAGAVYAHVCGVPADKFADLCAQAYEKRRPVSAVEAGV